MVRSSAVVGAEIAMIETSNKVNQNGINKCNTALCELQDKIDDLNAKKRVLDSTYSIYFDLKEYIVGHLESLEETSVCITEIKTESTEQIGGKIDVALKALEDLIGRIESALSTANTEYNTTYSQMQTYQTNLENGKQRLGTLNTELEQAKAAELPVM